MPNPLEITDTSLPPNVETQIQELKAQIAILQRQVSDLQRRLMYVERVRYPTFIPFGDPYIFPEPEGHL